jgi:hypothetical protein
MAMRCAERVGTCTMLWQHEFYMVNEPGHGAYVYQALEFKVGINLSPDEVARLASQEVTFLRFNSGARVVSCAQVVGSER